MCPSPFRPWNNNIKAIKTTYKHQVDSAELPTGATATVTLIAIKISDIKDYAQELIKLLSDTSWITKLNAVGQFSFEQTATRTINKLVTDFGTVQTNLTSSFGEYMVSFSAGQSLGIVLDHEVFPLSELWKEKLTNNPGFDFHTESPQNKISFGEAKYSKSINPYSNAASQIIDFIEDGKDRGDAALLEHFASKEAMDHLLASSRGFTVAFSINSDNPVSILKHALESEFVVDLCKKCDELQLVGVSS